MPRDDIKRDHGHVPFLYRGDEGGTWFYAPRIDCKEGIKYANVPKTSKGEVDTDRFADDLAGMFWHYYHFLFPLRAPGSGFNGFNLELVTDEAMDGYREAMRKRPHEFLPPPPSGWMA